MTILIIGNNGQLGWALTRRAKALGLAAVGVDMPELDLTDRNAVHRLVARDDCTAVVNAAAYTAVDKAQNDAETAFAVNRDGVVHLADACRKNGVPLVHVSTDYVFNGNGHTPYKPMDAIDPLGIYGQSKAAGETEVRNRLERHLIIRTSWLYGVHGNNFVKTMLRLARENRKLRVVDDQRGCPTFAGDLADAILAIVAQLSADHENRWGTYHYCNTGITSWYHLASKAIDLASRYEAFNVEEIVPIKTADYPTPAPRPAYSALDCSDVASAFDIALKPWEASLARMIDAFYGRQGTAG